MNVTSVDSMPEAELVPLYLPIPGNERTVPIAVHRALVRSAAAHKVALVGGVGALHVAIDRYESSAPEGGEECYVRVLDLTVEEEVWHRLVRSAQLGRTCTDPEVSWSEDRRSFTVNLTSAPPTIIALGGAQAVEVLG